MNLSKDYYRKIIRNVRLIVKCGICGHRVRIEFHHIKPTEISGDSRGSSLRAYDIIKKHPDCYIPLCYFCHRKVTSGEIDIRMNVLGRLQWTTIYGHAEEIRVI